MHILIIRQDSVSLCAKEVVVQNPHKGKEDGNILLERCGFEVVVHLVSAEEELMEVLVANENGDGEADGRPERVAATHPVPKGEHVACIDPKLGHLLRVR
ncbi:hypothetical protein BC936DRAFT_145378 [Jimgerdemannia flammicorona]|uniref:Uncharacterized protein n=2 Tax=Jimgerdemannia flammicorona TaxID=994334 RepID=A0A433DA48_9FUNG|nr:hypothetical protein BC936DRAFT_145378 [Jimgerdemannia flammicorona]RUS30422.1 hypothetical protein BC938DRAFT_479412 [Jimgerdemannia flammicorona]